MSYLDQQASVPTPTTPSSGFTRLYPKTVSGVTYLFYKDDAGVEYQLGQGLPAGGITGQVLTKNSATNFDISWANPSVISLGTTARNQTGSTIPAGSVVYINGATGATPTIALAQANAESTSARTYGVTAAAIANNASGPVVHIGLLENIDTSAFTAGQVLYLSPTVAGGITATKPSAPSHLVYVGICIQSNPSIGKIEVQIQNGYELDELHNVAISSPSNLQALTFNSSTNLWNNHTLTPADIGAQPTLGFTPENVSNKSTNTALGSSDTLYPSQNAVKSYVDSSIVAASTPDATTTIKGKIKLAGDLSGTADSPTVPALSTKEPVIIAGTSSQYWRGDKTWQTLDQSAVGLGNVDNTSDVNKPISNATQTALNAKEDSANKSTNNSLGTSDVLYPSQNAVKTYVDTAISASSTPDASTTVKGKVKLAGDLSGTADLPTVPALANKANTSTTISTTTPLSGGGDLSANRTLSISQASGSTDGYLSSTDWNTFNGKQAALGFTPENVTNKATNLTSPDNTKYPTTQAVSTALATKQDSLGYTPENVANKDNGSLSTSTTTYPTSGATKTYIDTGLSGKQNTLGFTPEDVANKATNLTSPDNTKYPTTQAVTTGLGTKQDTLVSGTNIKTINGSSILGSGNLVISGGGGLGDSFETVSKNLKAYNYSLTYSSGILTTMTYSLGGSSYVYKTFNYNLDGTLASIVLSGSIPSGITTTKTLTYSGGNLSSIAYT